MKRLGTTMLITVLVVLFALAIWMPSEARGPIRRLAADSDAFGFELFTDDDPPGIAVYTKTVYVPVDANTLYATISTTGDTHGGAAACFTALVDGAFFNGGFQGASTCKDDLTMTPTNVAGWVALLKLPEPDGGSTNCPDGGGAGGDCHDNSIYYQWCTPILPGTHTVEIRMATSQKGTGATTVFIEQAFFYIDASGIQGATTGCPGPAGGPSGG